MKAHNLSQIWRKKSCGHFLLRVVLLRFREGSSTSADVPVDSSVAASVSVEDMVQTNVPLSTSVGVQPASAGTVGLLCFNEIKAKDFEKMRDLVLTSDAFPGTPSRESVQSLVKTCLDMCAVDLTEVCSPALFNERSMQLGLSTGVAADLETRWNLKTKSRRDRCTSELGTAKPKILTANPPCPLFLDLRKRKIGNSNKAGVNREYSHHNTISSHLCGARVLLNRCIVVITSSSNVHRTRRLGMNSVFRTSLHSKVFL